MRYGWHAQRNNSVRRANKVWHWKQWKALFLHWLGCISPPMRLNNTRITARTVLRFCLYCARNYRPCFRENQPIRSFSIKWKRAIWACFRENWVYKFGHCTRHENFNALLDGTARDVTEFSDILNGWRFSVFLPLCSPNILPLLT